MEAPEPTLLLVLLLLAGNAREAADWYSRALANGYAPAERRLDALRDRTPDAGAPCWPPQAPATPRKKSRASAATNRSRGCLNTWAPGGASERS
jgi:hypothetical protein